MQVQTDAKFVQKHIICRPDEKYLFKLYDRQARLDSFPRSGLLPSVKNIFTGTSCIQNI